MKEKTLQALYESKVVKQVLSYLRLLLNPRDEMAFDVIAKHQKLPKTFAGAWRAYRNKVRQEAAVALFFQIVACRILLQLLCSALRRIAPLPH